MKNPRENEDKQMADFKDSRESRVSFVVGFRRRVKQLNTAAGNMMHSFDIKSVAEEVVFILCFHF